MQHTDQIDDRICLRNEAIQRGIVMDIGFDHLYGWQHKQMTGAGQMARSYDNMTARRSEPRDDVRADETATANN
jgi:hypothetical protein